MKLLVIISLVITTTAYATPSKKMVECRIKAINKYNKCMSPIYRAVDKNQLSLEEAIKKSKPCKKILISLFYQCEEK